MNLKRTCERVPLAGIVPTHGAAMQFVQADHADNTQLIALYWTEDKKRSHSCSGTCKERIHTMAVYCTTQFLRGPDNLRHPNNNNI